MPMGTRMEMPNELQPNAIKVVVTSDRTDAQYETMTKLRPSIQLSMKVRLKSSRSSGTVV